MPDNAAQLLDDTSQKKATRLCKVCDQIGTSNARWFLSTGKDDDLTAGLGIYIHRRDLHSLKSSALRGCIMCEFILSTVVNSDDARHESTLDGDIVQDCQPGITTARGLRRQKRLLQKHCQNLSPGIAYSLPTTFVRETDILQLHELSKWCGIGRVILIGTTRLDLLPSNLRAVVLYPFPALNGKANRKPFIAGQPFELATRIDDPLRPLATAWMVSPTLFTTNLLNRIRGWSEECLARHPKCRGTRGPQPFPSRVIELNTAADCHTIRLRDTRGKKGIYATLSYCWGTRSQVTTTKSTLSKHKAGIQISGLPATIRDAIKLCQSLGIQYLWVDSLCIVQDDLDDWHYEAAEMAAIYGRSALTISTPQNRECDESFNEFQHIQSQPGVPSLPEIVWQQNGLTGSVTARLSVLNSSGRPRPGYSIGAKDIPWMTRGWTLQEWLLSPRVLHCGRERMWDCYQTWYTESGLTYDSSSGVIDDYDRVGDGLVPQIFARMARLDPDIRGSALDTHWARLVEDFTSRTLSREMDKMPAVAGLAAKFMEHSHAKALRAKYLAGLWYYRGMYPFEGYTYPTSLIPLGLLWRRSAVGNMRSPNAYRAPSWSWAALDGQVSLFRPQWLLFDLFGDNLGFKEVKMMKVTTAGCLFDPPGSCSMVQTGWIIAMSPFKRAYINPSWKVHQFHSGLQEEYHKTFIGLGTNQSREDTPWFGIFDQSPEQTGIQYVDDSLYLLHVASVIRTTQMSRFPDIIHHALMVEKVGSFNDMDCFRRLGVAWYSPSKESHAIRWSHSPEDDADDRLMLKDWDSCKARLI